MFQLEGNIIVAYDSNRNPIARIEVTSSGLSIIPTSSGGTTLELGNTYNPKWGTIRLNAHTVDIPDNLVVHGQAHLSGGVTSPQHTQSSAYLGKCVVCTHGDSYIKHNAMLVCDLCYFAFTRNPGLQRLIQAFQTTPPVSTSNV